MELKPNMYVRTKTGIEQIYTIDNNKTKYKYLFKLKKQDGDGCIDCGVLSSEDIIGEPSFEIIDLIEVGDYVDGEKVIRTNCNVLYYHEDSGNEIDIYNALETTDSWVYFDSEITSIVTKEQFEAIQYKVV